MGETDHEVNEGVCITNDVASCVALIEALFGDACGIVFTGYSIEAKGELRGHWPYELSIEVGGEITLTPVRKAVTS